MTVRTALKRLERRGRRFCLRGIAHVMGRSAAAPRPDWGRRPHRVLFLRHDRIGDMIVSTGVIRAIARSQPTVKVDVLASPLNAPVLRQDATVSDVITIDRRRPWTFPLLLLRLRRARYDAVIDCMVTAPSLTTLLLMLASGAQHRIGVARRGNDFVYSLPVEPLPRATHIVDHLSALVAAFGLDPEQTDVAPHIALSTAEFANAEGRWSAIEQDCPRSRMLVNVSCGRAARNWPDERFVAVLRRLQEHAPGTRPMLVAAPEDFERAARIARDGGATLVATATIRDVLALVATAERVFTPDTSIAHAASAFGKPAVVMFLADKAALWGPYGATGTSVESPDQLLSSLPVEPVLLAIDAMLGARDYLHPAASM